jgi:hypothetical protein
LSWKDKLFGVYDDIAEKREATFEWVGVEADRAQRVFEQGVAAAGSLIGHGVTGVKESAGTVVQGALHPWLEAAEGIIPDSEDSFGRLAILYLPFGKANDWLEFSAAMTEDEHLAYQNFYYDMMDQITTSYGNVEFQAVRRMQLADMLYHAERGNADKYGFVKGDPEYDLAIALWEHDYQGAYDLTYRSGDGQLNETEATVWNVGYPPYQLEVPDMPDEVVDLLLSEGVYVEGDFVYLAPQNIDGDGSALGRALNVAEASIAIGTMVRGNWLGLLGTLYTEAGDVGPTVALNQYAETTVDFPLKPPEAEAEEAVEEVTEVLIDGEELEAPEEEPEEGDSFTPPDFPDPLPYRPPGLDLDLPENLAIYFGLLVAVVGFAAAVDILNANMLTVPKEVLAQYAPNPEDYVDSDPDPTYGPSRDEEPEEPEPEPPKEAWFWYDLLGEEDIDESIPVEEREGYAHWVSQFDE